MPLPWQGHFLVPKTVIHRNTVDDCGKTVDKVLKSMRVIHNYPQKGAVTFAVWWITLLVVFFLVRKCFSYSILAGIMINELIRKRKGNVI